MNTIYQFSSSTRTDLGVKLLGSIEFTYDGKEKAEFIEWTEKNINDEITVYLQRHLNSKSITLSEVKRVQVDVGGEHGDTAIQFGASVSVDLIGNRIIVPGGSQHQLFEVEYGDDIYLLLSAE
jgi:hypothetical protein